MIPNMFRIAMAAKSSGFIGVTLDFGSMSGYATESFPPYWASLDGGTDSKEAATNVSLVGLSPSATITMVLENDIGLAPSVKYAKNNGTNTQYSAPFTVVGSDYLKIGLDAPQIGDGEGRVKVYANGTLVATIPYDYYTP